MEPKVVQFKPISRQNNSDMTGYHKLFGVYLHGKIEIEAGYDIVFAKNCETETCRYHYDGATDGEYDLREWEQAKFDTPCMFECQVAMDHRIVKAKAFIWEDKGVCYHRNSDGSRMFPEDYYKRYHGLIVALDDSRAMEYAEKKYSQRSLSL